MARTAFVSTYPPHRCGIATFTSDLARRRWAPPGRRAPPGHAARRPTPAEVRHRIRRDVARRLPRRCRARSNASDIDVVSIQHEYGIWGGADGDHVSTSSARCDIPVVTTLHTVLRHPTPSQRRILVRARRRDRRHRRHVPRRGRAADPRLRHRSGPRRGHPARRAGPAAGRSRQRQARPRARGPAVILSFGLLGPGQGLRVGDRGDARGRGAPSRRRSYVILGATHPDLLRHEGEAYRRRLEAAGRRPRRGRPRPVRRPVRGPDGAGTWLEAADIFVTPYPNLEQIVSGHPVVRDGRRQGDRLHPLRLRRASGWRTAGAGSCRPGHRPRSPRRSSSCSATGAARGDGPARVRATAAACSGRRSGARTAASSREVAGRPAGRRMPCGPAADASAAVGG